MVTVADLHRSVLVHTIGYEMRRRLVAVTHAVLLFDVDNTLVDLMYAAARAAGVRAVAAAVPGGPALHRRRICRSG